VNEREGAKKFRRRTEGVGEAGRGRTGVFFYQRILVLRSENECSQRIVI